MLANYFHSHDYIPENHKKLKSQAYFHSLTHSSLAIGVGVDLAIVLDDGQAGRDGGHHFILAVL